MTGKDIKTQTLRHDWFRVSTFSFLGANDKTSAMSQRLLEQESAFMKRDVDDFFFNKHNQELSDQLYIKCYDN